MSTQGWLSIESERRNAEFGFRALQWWVIGVTILLIFVGVMGIVKSASAGEFGELALGKEVVLEESLSCKSLEIADVVMRLIELDSKASMITLTAFKNLN